MPPVRRPIAERFWPKVRIVDAGCWIWLGGGLPAGYGTIASGGKRGPHAYAHRVAWELTRGPILKGMFVLHHCDNPSCVRPDHLFLGTPLDNMRDMARKGRRVIGKRWSGERNGNSKLTADRVRAMRRLRSDGLMPTELSWLFSISKGHVQRILKGTNWGAA